MKNVLFETVGQNVFITFTNIVSRRMTELYCIATSIDDAKKICNCLNYAKDNYADYYL